MALVSASSLNNRFTHLILASILLLGLIWFWIPSLEVVKQAHIPGLKTSFSQLPLKPASPPVPLRPLEPHPIDDLIRNAREEYATLEAKEAQSLQEAAVLYRERRGRQPPPLFDVWYHFARNQSALMVEDYFDQIYHDLAPFWGLSAKTMREQANTFMYRISIRNGNVSVRAEEPREWMDIWSDMVGSVAEFLPDLDMPMNMMDESRMIVPWAEISEYMQRERQSRRIVPEEQLKDLFNDLSGLDKHPPPGFDPGFDRIGPYWNFAVAGCSPTSAAKKAYIDADFSTAPPLENTYPKASYKGYVQNWTIARSPCDNPTLQGLHGTFVEPISISNTKLLFPLFGGSKLPMNNDILLPPAMYWSERVMYSGGDDHGPAWEKKKDSLIWRGAASGGRNKATNWKRFQRHRFVSMINATNVQLVEKMEQTPLNFVLPAEGSYDLEDLQAGAQPGAFGEWVSTWSDAAMVHLLCFPGEDSPKCSYTDPYYHVAKELPMKRQYQYKFLPDIDGNSFSGRYRGFLGSTSMPIKATIYQEWHDSRLVPWKHFVPMDNTFIDIYGIMQYFAGNANQGIAAHDEAAKTIAMEGKDWTERVLRKEDMQVYILRLLLEYARLCDDDRDIMGWKEQAASS